ncbi:MAG TPA: hypothetical protein VE972_15110 [Conexibacter sp.]|nr:hypothetical protein [Conexibacter sp.]
MRLIGLLSWYAERPSWLAGCIASYRDAGIEHLVAIDGAYALFPDGSARSSGVEVDSIVEVCNAHGIGLTLVRPATTWAGNEIEKRTSLFRHAEAIASPHEDWYLIIDADELVTRALDGWREQLARTSLDCADVLLWERDDRDSEPRAQVDRSFRLDPVSRAPIRKLFRAIPGLRCRDNHYTWVTPDGRELWSSRPRVPALDLTDHIHIEHRTQYRSLLRRDASHQYYRLRDAAGIER